MLPVGREEVHLQKYPHSNCQKAVSGGQPNLQYVGENGPVKQTLVYFSRILL